AANCDAYYIADLHPRCQIKDSLRPLHAKMTHGIEDPQQGYTEGLLSTPPAALKSVKEGLKRLSAPMNNADAHIDFGVQDVVLRQLLHEAVGNKLVIFGRAQTFSDRLEG